ncbi:MAG: ferredoxin--NADP reductase [Roseivirga sp.]|nr:ferredoxin--NADP reductase [Roseivirga sp.]
MAFGLFKKKKEAASEAPKKSGYINLKIKEVVNEIDDAISIHFEQPAAGDIQYQSGQFFTVIADINGKEQRRAYSLCSSPFVDANPAVTVKRVQGGLMSNYLNDNARAGQELRLMEPIGNFTTTFDGSNARHIVLFGGGSGITPLISIAKSALDQEPNSKVSLIYANQNIDSVIFRATLDQMVSESNGRFALVHVLENAPEGMECTTGWLTEQIIKESLGQLPQEVAEGTEYFMCGPGPMMDIVESSLSNLGIDKAQVHKESFTTTLDSKDEAASEASDEIIAREVTVIYDDEEFKYTVEPGETILEKGLDEDIDLPFSCQSGLCTACRGKCVSGKVKMDEDEGLSEAEMDEGYVLPCVSHPLTADVVIEIG